MKLLLLLTTLILINPKFDLSDKGPKSIKLPKIVKQNFAPIPKGVAIVDGEELKIDNFYLAKQEVSNIYYAEYLAHLATKNDTEKMQLAMIHPDKWLIIGPSMEPFAEHYHNHPAYNNYPVVNVSLEAAEGYCEWLEAVYNEVIEDGYRVELRIPTRAEWVYAAQNGLATSYSWGGQYLRNTEGAILCNFRSIGAESISSNPETGDLEVRDDVKAFHDNSVITASCESYPPSALGLYNMNGNVAEMVADKDIAVGGSWNSPGYDVRNESTMLFDAPSPFVGFRPLLKVVKN